MITLTSLLVAAVASLSMGVFVWLRSRCFGEEEVSLDLESRDPALNHVVLGKEQHLPQVLIIGDVHGCLEELKELLEVFAYDPQAMTVVLVGDLVNKGPHSAEVVRFVREQRFHCVLGNHDVSALQRVCSWQRGEKLPPKYAYVERLSEEDVRWLASLPFTIALPEFDAVVTHAGLVPGVPFDQQTVFSMTKMRNILSNSDGSLTSLERHSEGENWATFWRTAPHVYYGHDAKRGLQIHDFATGLDSGCCYGRELTGILLPSREIKSVRAKRVYEDKQEKARKKK